MNTDFTLALKSTIDYYAKTLADEQGLPFIDLDAEIGENAVLESDQPAVVWEFSTLSEYPMDPLYAVSFDIGVMTLLDPSQYVSLKYIDVFLSAFKAGISFPVMDYSGANMPSTVKGSLFIRASAVTQQQPDRTTGIRFVTVDARATRSG